MPRNLRQKKRAERRVQAAAATAAATAAAAAAAAAADEAAIQSMVLTMDNTKLTNAGLNEIDEHAMGDGDINNNNLCNAGNANGNASTSSSSSTNVIHAKKPKASRADPILASLSKNALRMSDVQLLHGPHWLNDAILNFYFAYLDEVKYKSNVDFLFVTPEMSQCMLYMDDKELQSLLETEHKAARKPFVFIAMNDNHSRNRGGAHWTLLVASRPDKCFYHFDSYGGSNTGSSQELVTNIKDVLGMQHARFRTMRCLQQSNDYDCGIHVICMADQLTDYVNRFDSVDGVQPLHQDVIKAKRNQLIKLVASLGQHI